MTKQDLISLLEMSFGDLGVVRNGEPILLSRDSVWDVLASRILHYNEHGDVALARKTHPRKGKETICA
jgi:hypothetical protein